MVTSDSKIRHRLIQKETDRILKTFGPRRALQYLVQEVHYLPIEEKSSFSNRIHELEIEVREKNRRLYEY